MGLLGNPILAREAFFAYIVCDLRLVEIYVPFVRPTEERSSAANSNRVECEAKGAETSR